MCKRLNFLKTTKAMSTWPLSWNNFKICVFLEIFLYYILYTIVLKFTFIFTIKVFDWNSSISHLFFISDAIWLISCELQVLCFPKCPRFIHALVASVLVYLLKLKTHLLMGSSLECYSWRDNNYHILLWVNNNHWCYCCSS